MIQDIYPHRLDIAYKEGQTPAKGDLIIHFFENRFLCREDADGSIVIPLFEEYPSFDADFVYLFKLDGTRMFLDLRDEEIKMPGYTYSDMNLFRSKSPRELLFALTTAYHLLFWHKDNVFCGRCGERTVHDRKERMMRCPKCGNTIYPRIMPSVIVGVTNGDKLLLTRYNRPGAKLAALVAGFCEIGETGEDTVRREVMEETGLKVKNIRYYATQPWGISAGGLLLGYWCDVDGDDTIHVDGDEIAEGKWMSREELKVFISQSYVSLTSEMMGLFAQGREYEAKAPV